MALHRSEFLIFIPLYGFLIQSYNRLSSRYTIVLVIINTPQIHSVILDLMMLFVHWCGDMRVQYGYNVTGDGYIFCPTIQVVLGIILNLEN